MTESTTAETIAIADTYFPTRLPRRFRSARLHLEFESGPKKMTPDEFWQFCADNDKLPAELTKDGDVLIMAPTGFETNDRNIEIIFQMRSWAKRNNLGIVTGPDAGFILPSGAVLAPDAAWTLKSRVDVFDKATRERFLPICPDFVVELQSPSNVLREAQLKMDEWIENGARLAWLVDPFKTKVHVYRPGREPEILENPKSVSGEDVLPGFDLDLTEIW